MTILSGIDIIEVDRIEKAINKNKKFINRIFSDEERVYINSRKNNIATISGMFAAKEAVSKVLGYGIREYGFKDIEIHHNNLGKPYVILNNRAKDLAKNKCILHITITISHIKEYALAFALGESNIIDKKTVDNSNNLKQDYKDAMTIDKDIVSKILPIREKESHKGTYGRVAVIAGSQGMSGAACLSSSSSIRSGSGIVYSIVPQTINEIVESNMIEVITKPIKDKGKGYFTLDSLMDIKNAINNINALAIGPGIGVDDERIKIVEDLLLNVNVPIILDADGLNCISNNTKILLRRKQPTIITPHPGELSRLLNISIKEIQKNRIKYAKLTSQKFNVITVLKGANTIICGEDETIYINTTGNPGMATAGSGDVLTGMILSFVGQGINPIKASVAGVYLHGLAGDLAAYEKGQYSMIASDIIENLPYAIKSIS